jgi:hypothetical protein
MIADVVVEAVKDLSLAVMVIFITIIFGFYIAKLADSILP